MYHHMYTLSKASCLYWKMLFSQTASRVSTIDTIVYRYNIRLKIVADLLSFGLTYMHTYVRYSITKPRIYTYINTLGTQSLNLAPIIFIVNILQCTTYQLFYLWFQRYFPVRSDLPNKLSISIIILSILPLLQKHHFNFQIIIIIDFDNLNPSLFQPLLAWYPLHVLYCLKMAFLTGSGKR